MQEYHARPRGFWAVLVALYIAQGIPGYLLIMAVPAALRAAGMPLQQVGMLSVLMLPLVLKFLWAPFVDRWQPLGWGHRRSWILCTQLATAAGVVLLALCGPQVPIATIVAIGMLISLSVATQDIATDGYATQQLRGTELGRGNAIQAAAVAGGVLIGGSLSLVLMERLGWQPALLLMAALCLLPLLTLPWMVEPERMPAAAAPGQAKTGPSLRNFLQRPGMLSVLALAVVFRLSEGMQRSMESSYLLHNELSLGQVGVLGGTGAAIAGLAGSALAALWLRWRSREQVLLALSGIRALVFALFLLHSLHLLGSDLPLVGLTVALSLLRYMEMVALYALFMSASSHSQPGTDFTILACAEFLTYMLSSMAGGFIAKQFGFSGLFVVTSALAVFSWLAVARLLLSYRSTSGGSVEAAA
ncbi:MFS transporter [Comamonas thiooxydans]|uniref:MFS transporter n=1 Tax=Comamonas thiooxydans TaxID=363952 RepID=UPI003CFEE671